jgi:hypothetical protein
MNRAVHEAADQGSALSAKTKVHRMRFPNAVRRAGFQYLPHGGLFLPGNYNLVIGVAPWSDPDLAALEDLASEATSRAVQVTIFDIDELSFPGMLQKFPGMRRFLRTPVVVQYREGRANLLRRGPRCRSLAASDLVSSRQGRGSGMRIEPLFAEPFLPPARESASHPARNCGQ